MSAIPITRFTEAHANNGTLSLKDKNLKDISRYATAQKHTAHLQSDTANTLDELKSEMSVRNKTFRNVVYDKDNGMGKLRGTAYLMNRTSESLLNKMGMSEENAAKYAQAATIGTGATIVVGAGAVTYEMVHHHRRHKYPMYDC